MGSVKSAELIEKINLGGEILTESGCPATTSSSTGPIRRRCPTSRASPSPGARRCGPSATPRWWPTRSRTTRRSPGARGELDFLLKTCLPLDDLEAEPQNTVYATVRNIMIQPPPPEPIIAVAFTKVRFLDPPDGGADVDVEIAAARFVGARPPRPHPGIPRRTRRWPTAGHPRRRHPGRSAVRSPTSASVCWASPGWYRHRAGHRPHRGPLRAVFTLGTRSYPFTLSVMGFGGSGSLELEASPHPVGIARLGLALAFVIELSVDVVVAKGARRASFGASLELTARLVDGEASAARPGRRLGHPGRGRGPRHHLHRGPGAAHPGVHRVHRAAGRRGNCHRLGRRRIPREKSTSPSSRDGSGDGAAAERPWPLRRRRSDHPAGS